MIEISHVDKWYSPTFQVLTDCTTSVTKGEVVVVCGPSGSGKSTLIKCVNALEPFQKGDISVDGTKVNDPKTNLPKLRSRVGMVFQHFELFPHLKIIDNLCLAQQKVLGRSSDKAVAKAMALLDRVGLKEQAQKFPAQLSGGQQQRVALARALAVQPSVLLLDEPLSALDARVRVQLRDEIRRLQLAEGITTLFVTHDQSEALAVADRVAVLNAGRLEQVDVPQEVYTRPATAFVAEFVGVMNEVPLEGGRIVPRSPHRVQVRPEGLAVEVPEGLPATVLTSTFLGAVTRFVLTSEVGELTVDVVSRPSLPGIGESTTVGLVIGGR
jgi:ABC-type Fe3+/spermidine/putrescine transport system ATPase subunit